MIYLPFYTSPVLAWSSVYALFFELLSLYLLIRIYETSEERRAKGKEWGGEKSNIRNENVFIIVTGISLAMAFLCKQNVGVYQLFITIIILIILYVINKDRLTQLIQRIILLLAGFLVIFGIFLVYLIISKSLNDWYIQNIKFTTIWINKFGRGAYYLKSDGGCIIHIYTYFREAMMKILPDKFEYVFNMIGSMLLINNPLRISLMWRVLPLVSIVVFINLVIRIFLKVDKSKGNIILLIVTMINLISWLQYYPVTEFTHTYWSVYQWRDCDIFYKRLSL